MLAIFLCSLVALPQTPQRPWISHFTASSLTSILEAIIIFLEKSFAMPVRSDYLLRSQVHRSPQRLGSIGHPQDLSFLDGPWYYATDESSHRRDSVSREWKKSYESDDTLEQESENTLVAGEEVEEEELRPESSIHPAREYSVCSPSNVV
jgi:hypothetical protein